MDREQEEIQLLGFFGILKESCNIVLSWTKIFSQITLALIIPLSFIHLAHTEISHVLFANIMHNEFMLNRTPADTTAYSRLSNALSSEWMAFFLFKIGYLVFFVILALLSTSAVVYTIACIYTAKEVTLRNVMSVVPKVWKRLLVTFIWNFIIVFSYNMVSLLFFIVGAVVLGGIQVVGTLFLVWFLICYFIGLLYITMIWNLASVVSMLEETYGLNAMAKSQALIKGKMGISAAVFLVVGLCFFGVDAMFQFLVVLGGGDGIGNRIGYGIVCLALMSLAMLFGLISHTIVYFVCKSYHHESIDKLSLADHLEGYRGEYVPLKFKDVQLKQFEV